MGKSKKKSWKAADVADIETGLEKSRADELESKPEAATNDLFVIDKTGNVGSRKTKKRRRKAGLPDSDSDDDNMEPRNTDLPNKRAKGAPLKKANRKRHKLAQKKSAGTLVSVTQKHSRSVRHKPTHSTVMPVKKGRKVRAVVHDCWAKAEEDEAKKLAELELHNGYEAHPDPEPLHKQNFGLHQDQTVVKRRRPLLADVRNANKLVVASDGTSFNPSPEEHQKLVLQALEVDKAERKKKARILAKFHQSEEYPEAHREWVAEAVAEDGASESVGTVSKSSKAARRRSTAEKNKARRKHKRAMAEAKAREQKKLLKDINKLPQLMSELEKEEQDQQEQAEIRAKTAAKDPRLGPHLFKEQFPDVNLSEDLSEKGSLREMKTSRQVVKDQFTRFQSSMQVETRRKVKGLRRRYALKTYKRFKNDVDW